MKTFARFIAATLAVSLNLAALAAESNSSPALPSAPSPELRAELIALETAWDDALVQKDRAALERIIADDFVLITAEGSIANKTQLLGAIASPDLHLDPFSTEDVVVRVYGDVAILTGSFHQTGAYRNNPFASSSRYTDVYVKRDGRWRAVSAQATALPPSAHPARAPGPGRG